MGAGCGEVEVPEVGKLLLGGVVAGRGGAAGRIRTGGLIPAATDAVHWGSALSRLSYSREEFGVGVECGARLPAWMGLRRRLLRDRATTDRWRDCSRIRVCVTLTFFLEGERMLVEWQDPEVREWARAVLLRTTCSTKPLAGCCASRVFFAPCSPPWGAAPPRVRARLT